MKPEDAVAQEPVAWLVKGPLPRLALSRSVADQWRQAGEVITPLYASPISLPVEVARMVAALRACVKVAKSWHGDIAWDIYYENAPEMKLVREALAPHDAAAKGDAVAKAKHGQ